MGRQVMRAPLDFQRRGKGRTPRGGREGWQMWETTSEHGSPISPAFETPEALARWLADTKASAFADQSASYEEWLSMIREDGTAFTMAFVDGECVSGVSALYRERQSGANKGPPEEG